MPNTIYLPADCDRSGIDITWYKTRREISVGGWYDSMVGIENTRMGLREFLDRLGITEADCIKVFKEATP